MDNNIFFTIIKNINASINNEEDFDFNNIILDILSSRTALGP